MCAVFLFKCEGEKARRIKRINVSLDWANASDKRGKRARWKGIYTLEGLAVTKIRASNVCKNESIKKAS